MDIGGFLDKLLAAVNGPEVVQAHGQEYLVLPPAWAQIPQPKEPEPKPLTAGTLSAIVTFLGANRDGLDLASLVVSVLSPTQVVVVGPLHGDHEQRFTYLAVSCEHLFAGTLALDQYRALDELVIGVQTKFVETETRATLLRLLGNVRDGATRQYDDDGVTQAITAKRGVTLGETVPVQNPWMLAPYRTFRDITQPVSPYVLRMKGGDDHTKPSGALIQADGDSWKLDAMGMIASFLTTKLTEADVAVPVLY